MLSLLPQVVVADRALREVKVTLQPAEYARNKRAGVRKSPPNCECKKGVEDRM